MSRQQHQDSAVPSGGLDAPFREALDAAPVMIRVSNEDGLPAWFNVAWLSFTGRTLAQELDGGWTEGVHPDDRERCLAGIARHVAGREPHRIRYRLKRHDGAYRWIDESGLPRRGGEGRLLGFINSCSDVHEMVEAEEELSLLKDRSNERTGQAAPWPMGAIAARHGPERTLEASEAQLHLLIQGIRDHAIFMLAPDGSVSSWNGGAARIKGYRAEEVIGRHFSLFYTAEDQASDLPARALREAETEGKFEAEGWRVRKDGSRFWASVVIDPIVDSSGRLVGFGKVTRDMTEKRRADEQLERARESMLQMHRMEAIGQLTGGVAHDFNNLLMVIMGNLDIAQRNVEGGAPARVARAIGNAMVGARRAATLTQRLLAFSRRQPLNPKSVDLNRFIASEVEFLQRTLGENVEIQAVGSAGVWRVEVDLNQLEAALLNLAVNARDAMPGGGTLTIQTSNAYLDDDYCNANPEVKRGQYVLLSVTDSGTGMTPDIAARAFEPFFSTKAVGHGTGLGLSQVYGFIKQSGGHVKIYSELGEGTEIKIYLPRSETSELAAPQEQASEPLNGDPNETILVVEDDEDVRAYLIESLRDLNYRVLSAQHSDAALAIIERPDIHIDLLLTDVVLPGMNGRELARKAQAMRSGLKVLFMTGYSRNAIVHQGRLDADVELVQKPVTQETLAARIRMLLDAPPRQDA